MSELSVIRVAVKHASDGSAIWGYCMRSAIYVTLDTAYPPEYVGGMLILIPKSKIDVAKQLFGSMGGVVLG